jgi:hypothetical protein
MRCGATLFGSGEPLRVGVQVVDLSTERGSERRGIQSDRQPADDQYAAVRRIQCGQLRLIRADGAPAIGNVVRQRRGRNRVHGVRKREQHGIGIGHQHQVCHEAATVEPGQRLHAVHRHQRQRGA